MSIFSKIFKTRNSQTSDPLLDEMRKRVWTQDEPLGEMCLITMAIARHSSEELSCLIISDEAGRVDKEMSLLSSLFFLYLTLVIRRAHTRLNDVELEHFLKYVVTLVPRTVIDFYRTDLHEDAKQILVSAFCERMARAMAEYADADLWHLLSRARSNISEICGQLNNSAAVTVIQEHLSTYGVIVAENLNLERLLLDIRTLISLHPPLPLDIN